jgi:hypothetical protein
LVLNEVKGNIAEKQAKNISKKRKFDGTITLYFKINIEISREDSLIEPKEI